MRGPCRSKLGHVAQRSVRCSGVGGLLQVAEGELKRTAFVFFEDHLVKYGQVML